MLEKNVNVGSFLVLRRKTGEAHVNDAIRENFKVKKVNSSHTKNQTEIISEEPLDEAKLKDVIAETGYELQGISSEPYAKKGLFGFGK